MAYLALQRHHDEPKTNPANKTVAISKCGKPPYEISLRFAYCNLKCGACFASGYSWSNKCKSNNRVVKKGLADLIKDYNAITYQNKPYNWMRILGGEPFLSPTHIDYLFDFFDNICNTDKFQNRIVIQTNGILLGSNHKNSLNILQQRLDNLYKKNKDLKIVIEISLKGSNPNEFDLITQVKNQQINNQSFFQANIKAYYNLKNLNVSNMRPTVIAGFGISESLLQGNIPQRVITILNTNDTPIFHQSNWSKDFQKLYDVFIKDWVKIFKSNVPKMPMYGFQDAKNDNGWRNRSFEQAKKIYGNNKKNNFLDIPFEYLKKNPALFSQIKDICDKFFYPPSNHNYYTMLFNNW